MATYTYTGNTYQNAVGHANKLVAIKVDVGGNPVFSILDETSADGAGAFTLQWEDWSGRVIIGAVDDDGTIQQLQAVFHDYLTGEQFTYSSAVLADGPDAYYKLDETSGTTVIDSAGTNNGTYVNSPTLNSSSLVVGEPAAVTFDGIADHITTPFGLPASGDFTIESWVTLEPGAADSIKAVSNNVSTQVGRIDLGIGGTGAPLFFFGDGASNVVLSSTTGDIRDNTIHHFVVTRSGSTFAFYVDGVFQTSGTSAVNASTQNFNIGRRPADSGYWDGKIDEVAFYTRAVTGKEIKNHYYLGAYGLLVPLSFDSNNKASAVTLSNNGKTMTTPRTGQNGGVAKSIYEVSGGGKYYYEITYTSNDSGAISCRAGGAKPTTTNTGPLGFATDQFGYSHSGQVSVDNVSVGGYPTYTVGDIISVLLDLDTGAVAFWKNGADIGAIAETVSTTESWCMAAGTGLGSTDGTNTYTLAIDRDEMTYSPPAGYKTPGE